MAAVQKNAKSANFDWDRSFSEPDLTAPTKHLNRFAIKHPHEYISVDDLKFFRRRKPPDFHTQSNICLHNQDEPVLPFSSLKTEYEKQFKHLELSLRPRLLRRSTSLRLEGLMHHLSEHQEQYHWYTPEDCLSCRTFPIRNPENLHVGEDNIGMSPEYRSSYISHPMVDRTAKILPREMFRIESEPTVTTTMTNNHQHDNHQQQQQQQRQEEQAQSLDCSPEEIAAINKLSDDKFKRDLAAQEQQKCHLQTRDLAASSVNTSAPSEYQRQFVKQPLGKAHSIPQISHIKMHGDFLGIPEYSASFKMYDNYSKSAPIKKADNLQQSGAEAAAAPAAELPEYREKFRGHSKNAAKDSQSLKTEDHLYPRGEFSKDLPEYYESFQDPQIKEMPERGKCREPYLRLKGKIEFNPEYRSTYLDFPRSRPIVKKSTSSFRLPTSTSTTTTTTHTADPRSPKRSPRRKYKSSSPKRYADVIEDPADLTSTPEYRRAQYNYQLRERTPPRKIIESDGGGNAKLPSSTHTRRSSLAYAALEPAGKISNAMHKRRPSRRRAASILDKQQSISTPSSFDNVIGGSSSSKLPARFGRRATVLQNAANCREKSSIIEGNPKYALSMRHDKFNCENQDSFVVLKEPCKRTNWMKKSWYES